MSETIRRPMARLDVDRQIGLFAEEPSERGKRPAPEAPVAFLDPDPEEIFLGNVPLRQHLQAMGIRDAFVVREVLQGLDFSVFVPAYRRGGRPAFAPASMVGIVLYGLMRGVSSLRELERFARADLGCMWVSGGNMPDHSVLGRFIGRHEQALSRLLFEQVVQAVLARTRSARQSLAGDGTVIEAMSSRYGLLKREVAEERLAALPEQASGERAELATMLATLAQRHEQNGGRGHEVLNPTEPEACVLRQKGQLGARASYVPTVLANEARVVVDAEVDSTQELKPMQAMLERQAGALEEVLLDAGFRSEALLERVIDQGISVLMPARGAERGTRPAPYFPPTAFVYDAESDGYRCPAGAVLKPEARYRTQHRARYTTRACRGCLLRRRCTQSERRVIERTRASELREGLAEVMAQPRARARYAMRQAMVEPVFSHLRGQQGLHRFRRRGLAKVRLEFRLHIMAYNLSRAVAAAAAFFGSARAFGRLWEALWDAPQHAMRSIRARCRLSGCSARLVVLGQ